MKKRHIYTEADNNLILEAVKAHPTNLMEAFNKVAKKLKVTPSGISNHYYRALQKPTDNKIFLTVSEKKASKNYKVTRKGPKATKYQPEKCKKSKWKRILAILAE